MKVSEKWLREWADPPVSSRALAEQLTMLGLEVETIEQVRPRFSNVVVGRVTAIRRHPQVDGQHVCRVDVGDRDVITVVCGAPNIVRERHYACVLVDGELATGQRIQVTEIAGVTSAGMLCSAAELGLADVHDELLQLDANACPGADLAQVLELDDQIFDISLTPNRGDCLSVAGVAREVSVLNRCTLRLPEVAPAPVSAAATRQIELEAAAACPRYVGRVVAGVDVAAPTPTWIAERLRRCGVRGINIVVDITNYVMLEQGQPMHAFDNERLDGAVSARFARPGESIRLLDEQVYALNENTLVIADGTGAVAMAGIMGGSGSAVGETTRDVFLESAFFSPQAIRGRARQYALQTDASFRFERGVDYQGQRQALERATALILAHCGGAAGPVTEAVASEQLPSRSVIRLRVSRIAKLLGMTIAVDDIMAILRQLGCILEPEEGGWTVSVPSWRFDVDMEADLIEEVARVHGYNLVPSRSCEGAIAVHRGELDKVRQGWRAMLTARGYHEVITYSFVDEHAQQRLFADIDAVPLLNPISTEMAVLRVSLWPGLLDSLRHNRSRQLERIRLFETGRVYGPGNGYRQTLQLAGLICGNMFLDQWDRRNYSSDFFEIKGDVSALIAQAYGAVQVDYLATDCAALHPGQRAAVVVEGRQTGRFGALHPGLSRDMGIDTPVYLFELSLPQTSPKPVPKYAKISKFPSIRRDISIVVDADIAVARIMTSLREHGTDHLDNLQLFDVYDGEGIDLGKKSLALGLTFRKSSSTLIDEEVDQIVASILERLAIEFGARLRE